MRCESESKLDSSYGGEWTVKTYRNKVDKSVTIVLQKGRIVPGEPTLVRMHATSFLDDTMGRVGPRKRVLQRSMEEIGKEGAGVIVMLLPKDSESVIQEMGHQKSTGDLRDYGIGAQILADLGVHEMILLSNSDQHVVAIEGYDLTIVGKRAIP